MNSDSQPLYEQAINELCKQKFNNDIIKIIYSAFIDVENPNAFEYKVEEVAIIIYELDKSSIEKLLYNVELLISVSNEKGDKVVNDLLHSIKYNVVLRNYVLSKTESLEESISNLEADLKESQIALNQTQMKLDSAQKKTKKINKIIDKMENMKSSIYTDFIAILGIFTAITFALFGGFSAVGAVSNALKHPSSRLFGYDIVSMALLFLFICLILIILFNGIFKINNRDVISKYRKKSNNESFDSEQIGYPISPVLTCFIGMFMVVIIIVGIGFIIW